MTENQTKRPSSDETANKINEAREASKIKNITDRELWLLANEGWNDKEIMARRARLEEGWTEDEVALARKGWIREPITREKEGQDIVIGHKMIIPYREEYWEVTFHEKAHQNDSRDVELGVDGEVLLIKRGEPVIVPERFLKAADHGVYDVFQQMPGETRKRVSKIQTYRYTRIKPRSKEEYEEMKALGDKVQSEHRQRQEQTQG